MVIVRGKVQQNAELGGSWDWARTVRFASWFVVAAGSYWMMQRILA